MGVSCTLLGHKYGEAEIEREREERGEEAVVTIREVKTCARCGDRSIVSENKEVTSVAGVNAEVATPDDADAAPTSQPRPTEPDSDDPVAAESVDEADPDAETAGEGSEPEATTDGSDGAGTETSAGTDADDATEQGPEHDPETDDGVILEDEEPEPAEKRSHGEWPDADEDHASAEADPTAAADDEPAPWPDSDEDADEGFDATTPDGEPAPDVEYPRNADVAPVNDGRDDDDAGDEDGGEILTDDGTQSEPADEGEDFERARPSQSPSGPSSGGTELFCPACGYRDPSTDGSLREGDICPECRKGYLAAGE